MPSSAFRCDWVWNGKYNNIPPVNLVLCAKNLSNEKSFGPTCIQMIQNIRSEHRWTGVSYVKERIGHMELTVKEPLLTTPTAIPNHRNRCDT